jgi:hypothetical protein
VILTFTLPKETVDRRPLKQRPAIEIYRGIEQARTNVSAPLLVTIPSAMVDRYTQKDQVRYVDSLNAADFGSLPFISAVYTIRTSESAKKSSLDSNVAGLLIYPAADAIADLEPEITHAGVALTWTPPRKTLSGSVPLIVGYHIYRADVEQAAQPAAAGAVAENPKPKESLAQIASTTTPTYADTQARFDHTYVYSVRSVAQYPNKALESADSNSIVVTPKDIFPPAAPQGLVAVLVPAQGESPAHLELSWAISAETDIAGYNIYRSEQAAVTGNRLNTELLRTPAFRDTSTLPGHRYSYSVTAVDRAGNESPASDAVSAGVPAESQP